MSVPRAFARFVSGFVGLTVMTSTLEGKTACLKIINMCACVILHREML